MVLILVSARKFQFSPSATFQITNVVGRVRVEVRVCVRVSERVRVRVSKVLGLA